MAACSGSIPSDSLSSGSVPPNSIPSSLVAPKRQRRSTDHSKIVVKNYKSRAATESSNGGALLTHFKSLSYKPQKRLRKKKKADPKLVEFLWRQIDSADIHAVSCFQGEPSGFCCQTNKYHSMYHHFACSLNQRQNKTKKHSLVSCNNDGKVARTSISIRELLL